MNGQKTPLAKSLNIFAATKAQEAVDQLGQALPGHVVAVDGSIVTVAFDVIGLQLDQVTMPVFGPEYIRYPIQVNDRGVAFPASFYLGGVSGLGGGTADTRPRGNLSCLVWFPCGNANWATVDPNAVTVYGPNGVVLQDTDGDTVVTLTPSGISTVAQSTVSTSAGDSSTVTVGSSSIQITTDGITIAFGEHSILINASGVTIDGAPFLEHIHSAVQAGDQLSGPVVPGS